MTRQEIIEKIKSGSTLFCKLPNYEYRYKAHPVSDICIRSSIYLVTNGKEEVSITWELLDDNLCILTSKGASLSFEPIDTVDNEVIYYDFVNKKRIA